VCANRRRYFFVAVHGLSKHGNVGAAKRTSHASPRFFFIRNGGDAFYAMAILCIRAHVVVHEFTGPGVAFCHRVPPLFLFDSCHAWHQQRSAKVVAIHDRRAENRSSGLLFQRFVCAFCGRVRTVFRLWASEKGACVTVCCLLCDSAVHTGLHFCGMHRGDCTLAPGRVLRFGVWVLLRFPAHTRRNQLYV